MSQTIKFTLAAIACGALALVLALVSTSNAFADSPPVAHVDTLYALNDSPQDAGSASAVVDTATQGSAAATPSSPQALPDPVESPSESAGLLYRLYKAGQLLPAIIVAAFFLLKLLEKWIAWFRVGWRKLAVTAALAGLGMLAERAASGTSPNLMMWMGALGVIVSAIVNFKGDEKPEASKA